MESIISIENVFFTYADGTEALRDITLEIQPNEVFVLFGPAQREIHLVAITQPPFRPE